MIFHRTWYLGFCKEEAAVIQCPPSPGGSLVPACTLALTLQAQSKDWGFSPSNISCFEPGLREALPGQPGPFAVMKSPSSHLLPLSLKAAHYPHLEWQSWDSHHVPPHQWLSCDQLVPEEDVPALSPSLVPCAAEHIRMVELAQPCLPYRGKKKGMGKEK